MRNVRYDIGDILEMDCSDGFTHRYLVLGYYMDTNNYIVVEYDSKGLWLSTLTDNVRFFPKAIKKIGHADISQLQQTEDKDVPDEEEVEHCNTCKKVENCDDAGKSYGLEFFTSYEEGMWFDDIKPWRFCPECGRKRK